MKNLLTILALLFVATFALAQNPSYSNQVNYSGGFPYPTVRVCVEPAVGTPCTPLATIYSDPLLTQPLANPFTGSSTGQYVFYAAVTSGVFYHVQVSGSGLLWNDISYVALPTSGGSGGGTVTGTANQIAVTTTGTVSKVGFTNPAVFPGPVSAPSASVPSITGNITSFPSPQLFPVTGAFSDLVLGNTFINPGPTLASGSVWLLNNSLNSNPHIAYWDGTFSEVALTNLDNPSNMANGVVGTGATVLANSPTLTTPNVGNATGISLTLELTTGDLFAMQSGSVTPYIQAIPQTGWIKTGYGSDNRYQISNNDGAFSDALLFSDTVAGSGSPTVVGVAPLVMGSVNRTGQTAAVGSTTIAAVPVGQYQLSTYINELPTLCSNVTAGSVQAQISYSDTQGSTSHNLTTMNFTTSGAANAQSVYTFWNNSTAVVVDTVYTACTTGTGTYDIHFSLERLQ